MSVGLAYAYMGGFVFGVPLYMVLCRYGRVGWPTFLLSGFCFGVALLFLITLVETGSSGHFSRFLDGGVFALFVFAGLLGAVMGATIWLIARPDRRMLSA